MLSRGRPFRQYIPFMILSAHWSWWFFPRPFPRYGILCHGLCHTTLMDHRESSKRPWSLIVPCNIDHHTRRVPCASRGTKMWNIALVMQLMHSLWHARVCVCVYVCFLCSGWTFCPPFFGTVFFSPWMSATTACDPSPDSHHNCWAPSIKISWHIVKVTYCHTYSIFANPFWNEDIGGVCFWLVFAFVVIVIYPHHDIWRNPSCSLRMSWYNRKKDTGGAPWMLPQPSHRGLPASLKASSLFLQFLHKLTSEFWGAKDLHFSMKCLATEFTSIYYTCCVDVNLSIYYVSLFFQSIRYVHRSCNCQD